MIGACVHPHAGKPTAIGYWTLTTSTTSWWLEISPNWTFVICSNSLFPSGYHSLRWRVKDRGKTLQPSERNNQLDSCFFQSQTMVSKPNNYELNTRQPFYFILTLFTLLTRCWTSPHKHTHVSSPLCDCWHLFECFSQFSCQQLSHLSHSGSLFSYSTVAAGDILTDCGLLWAGDENEMEMESQVRSVEDTLCSFLWHNSTYQWSSKSVLFFFHFEAYRREVM